MTRTSAVRCCSAGILALHLMGLVVLYPMVPSEIPIHLSFDGTLDMVRKTPLTWVLLWAIGVFVVFVVQALTSWLARPDVWAALEKPRYETVSPEEREELRERLRFTGALTGFLMALLFVSLNGVFVLAAVRRQETLSSAVGVTIVAAVVLISIAIVLADTFPRVRRPHADAP